ncbi:MAG: hypothetical protein H8E66_30290 [Planctomycetes bacterium]|nr:hypothetical protein [Planctomycetota bacterium]
MNQWRYPLVAVRSAKGHLFAGRITKYLAMFLAIVVWMSRSDAQEPAKQGVWRTERDEQASIQIEIMEMTLTPRAESNPALKHQLLADDFNMLDGNAATYYLKAQGFFEQTVARDRLTEFYEKSRERSRLESKPFGELPPHNWLSMHPGELPIEEVKEFLTLTAFQPRFLKEAAARRRFDLDRNIQGVDDPIGYLLPAIQSMREIARIQSLRCKVAIAEGRLDDAIEILRQQYALARHLGHDDFLVTNLVGMAIASIAWSDALTFVQQADAPNLYWALASLPRPLVDVSHAMSVERHFLYLQLKVLREVDESPRPVGYWQDFLDRLIPQIRTLASDFGIAKQDTETVRAMMVGYIAASYPGAKRYLIEDLGLSREQVEAYPTAQVVFLAMVRYYDSARDYYFKWIRVPYWQSRSVIDDPSFNENSRRSADRVGWSSAPTQILLPAVLAVQRAAARNEQKIALLQTVEAIRMYGAAHEGKLPPNLNDLPVPAPMEPFTGKPLDYEFHSKYAVLNGHAMPGLQYRLVLRFATK